MKLEARQLPAFLRQPPATCRVVLLHGDDGGLIRERAEQLTRTVAGTLDDPFRVAELHPETHNRLEEEATAMALTGGRRVVRVREVGDGLAAALRKLLGGAGDALIILEAPGLGRGKLRTLVEGAPDAAAIGCYPEEGRALEASVRALLSEQGISIAADALTWLTQNLGADRGTTRSEIEKLALYAGPGGRIDLDAAEACLGDATALSVDEALFAATAGRMEAMDRALERALAEGLNAIGVLRPALYHLQRLHQARLAMETGISAAEAMKSVRPPVFFRNQPAFTQALSLWSAESLFRAMNEAQAVELACKTTGSRPELLCRRFLTAIARQAAARRRG
ncbi:MAG TPA: DNA polymerase III subunit delta [Acetobacteraceae bacterium]|nr:DNA polymerase III subunit delta [Acetobacteraceae bacterium]